MSIRQLIALWQASPYYTGVRIRTRRDYAYRCQVIENWCGDAELADLTRGLVRHWYPACHQIHPVKA